MKKSLIRGYFIKKLLNFSRCKLIAKHASTTLLNYLSTNFRSFVLLYCSLGIDHFDFCMAAHEEANQHSIAVLGKICFRDNREKIHDPGESEYQ